MAFSRRWLLILCALVLGGSQLFAASREDRAYAAAVAAFQDKIWDRAESQLAQFIRNYQHSTNVPTAVLMQAQAEFKQGRFVDAAELLTANQGTAGRLADQYVRWLGEAQFAQGDFRAAAETFTGLVERYPESPLCLGAVVEAAAAREKLGEWAQLDELLDATTGIFARTERLDPDNELVASGRLLLAQSKFSQKNFAAAAVFLNRLNPQTLSPEQDYKRLHLLCQVKLAVNDLDAALAAAMNLQSVARGQKNAEWQADSVVLCGRVLGEKKLFPEAIAAWMENLTNTVPVAKQQEAILNIAALAAAQKKYTDAESALEKYLAQFTNAPAADLALLTLGELHLKEFVSDPAATNQLALAQANFDRLLTASTNGPLSGKAHLDRGWCFWLAGKIDGTAGDLKTASQNITNSLADFADAAKQLPFSKDLAVAKFKLGDAQFALNDFAGSTNSYQSVLDDFGGIPAVASSLGDRALYQILRACLELRAEAGAETALRQLLKNFSKSELADNGLLLMGEAFSDFGQPANARKVFEQFEKQFPGSPLRPEEEFAVARTFEREQNWRDAITSYANWLKDFSTNDLLPQVKFALAQAEFHAGDESGAFRLFTSFVTKFPTNELAPLAQWWVADYYFRATNFAGVENYFAAETNYENIFQNPAWKASSLVYPAQLMAGRAAMARQGFSDANRYFAGLISNTNFINDINSPVEKLKVQARFAFAASLMQTPSTDTNNPFMNLQLATNILSQLLSASETGVRALGEIGDCALQMSDYDGATNAYTQVANSPLAGADLRGRAKVGLGMALEKKAALLPPAGRKALLKQALNDYLDLIYADEETDAFWQKKAGLQALPLMISFKDGDVDKFFDRLERWLPQLRETLEKKRTALKN